VIAVGEATSGPAVIRRSDALHVFDEPAADSVEIGDLRIAPDPDAVVDYGAEMFDEVPINVRADLGPRRLRGNFDIGVGGKRPAESSDQTGGGEGDFGDSYGMSCYQLRTAVGGCLA
jgi:hypothetical protein